MRYVIVVEVPEDTDPSDVRDEMEEHFGDEGVSVFESERDAFADYVESGRQFDDVTGGRFA